MFATVVDQFQNSFGRRYSNLKKVSNVKPVIMSRVKEDDASILEDLIELASIRAIDTLVNARETQSLSFIPARGRGRPGPVFDANLPLVFGHQLGDTQPLPKGRARFINKRRDVDPSPFMDIKSQLQMYLEDSHQDDRVIRSYRSKQNERYCDDLCDPLIVVNKQTPQTESVIEIGEELQIELPNSEVKPVTVDELSPNSKFTRIHDWILDGGLALNSLRNEQEERSKFVTEEISTTTFQDEACTETLNDLFPVDPVVQQIHEDNPHSNIEILCDTNENLELSNSHHDNLNKLYSNDEFDSSVVEVKQTPQAHSNISRVEELPNEIHNSWVNSVSDDASPNSKFTQMHDLILGGESGRNALLRNQVKESNQFIQRLNIEKFQDEPVSTETTSETSLEEGNSTAQQINAGSQQSNYEISSDVTENVEQRFDSENTVTMHQSVHSDVGPSEQYKDDTSLDDSVEMLKSPRCFLPEPVSVCSFQSSVVTTTKSGRKASKPCSIMPSTSLYKDYDDHNEGLTDVFGKPVLRWAPTWSMDEDFPPLVSSKKVTQKNVGNTNDVSLGCDKIPEITQDPDRHVILIENVPLNITKQSLTDFLSTFGDIQNVTLIETTKCYNYAYIVVFGSETCEWIISCLNENYLQPDDSAALKLTEVKNSR